ncbi:DUF1134 domain-containing protein [Guyparkeria hydrothermalis]|uniref:DUF1134 domain-containing protein n=1 Tax=Guyparkeria hydrothermalis TaxID=923 RepID=UPI0020212591|nr:DUF1134 domain-containing protein [Guyparkeria hydrothermalis]MCL7744538.1 DUF1134 domain-containing protein [Guyparkeria hydrothermalis]
MTGILRSTLNQSSGRAISRLARLGLPLAAALMLGACATQPANNSTTNSANAAPAQSQTDTTGADQDEGYDKYQTTQEAVDFLGGSAEAIAKVVDRAFAQYGRPNAIIKGEEGGGALFVGLRYGQGEFMAKSGETQKVYWQGPSIGWDFGGDAGRVFMLVYNLPRPDLIFQRFAGVSGSAFLVGGVGMHYLRSQSIVVAPIRVGVGVRLGASVGYVQFTQEQSYNPF